MRIANFDLDRDVMLIAEIGNNHEGSYALAEELIGLAARAGADAVKFQTFVPERLVAPSRADRLAQLRRFCLTHAQFEQLARVAAHEGVIFLSTPFDIDSARFLQPLVPAFKIASGDNDFYPLLDAVARMDKPILLSCGMADLDHIRATRDFILRAWAGCGGTQDLALLHCVVSYPTDPADANLLAIRQLQQLCATVGYSDHTLGIDAAVLAVAMGARIIEKHFTIAKNHSDFRDHRLSADPADLAELSRRIDQARLMMGTACKRALPCEVAQQANVRRSIVAGRELKAGTTISWTDLDWIRGGEGLPCGQEAAIVGRSLARPLQRGQPITPRDCQ